MLANMKGAFIKTATMDTSTYSGLLLSKGITTERDRIIEQYILRQSTWDSLPGTIFY